MVYADLMQMNKNYLDKLNNVHDIKLSDKNLILSRMINSLLVISQSVRIIIYNVF
jgi:hypothetical protein